MGTVLSNTSHVLAPYNGHYKNFGSLPNPGLSAKQVDYQITDTNGTANDKWFLYDFNGLSGKTNASTISIGVTSNVLAGTKPAYLITNSGEYLGAIGSTAYFTDGDTLVGNGLVISKPSTFVIEVINIVGSLPPLNSNGGIFLDPELSQGASPVSSIIDTTIDTSYLSLQSFYGTSGINPCFGSLRIQGDSSVQIAQPINFSYYDENSNVVQTKQVTPSNAFNQGDYQNAQGEFGVQCAITSNFVMYGSIVSSGATSNYIAFTLYMQDYVGERYYSGSY